jgi:dTDP-4-dehydrorhamnose 3,5-epimerase
MLVEQTPLSGCWVIHDHRLNDGRGYFFESYNRKRFLEKTGKDVLFVQDNQSCSQRGVIRGLHYQLGEHAQAKLVRVLQGSVLDVAVDLRTDSPTFGQSFSIVLSEESGSQLFIPRGFAHGFEVLSEQAVFFYKCDNYYNKAAEGGIHYNDPSLGIHWRTPEEQRLLSEKDRELPLLQEVIDTLHFS